MCSNVYAIVCHTQKADVENVTNIPLSLPFIPLRSVHLNDDNEYCRAQETAGSARLNLSSFQYRLQVDADVWDEVLFSTFTVTELRLGGRVSLPEHNCVILLWRPSRHNTVLEHGGIKLLQTFCINPNSTPYLNQKTII